MVFGLSLPAVDGNFFEAIITSANAAAEEAGITLNVAGAGWDSDAELSNVQTMIDDGADALMLLPVNLVDSANTVLAANEAGIPVYVMLTDLFPAEDVEIEIAGTIAPDPEATGVKTAEYVCEVLSGEGSVLELTEFEPVDMTDMTEEDMAMLYLEDMIYASFNTHMADECSSVTLNTTNLADVDTDTLFDAVDAALAAAEYDLVLGYAADAAFEAVNVAFATRNRTLQIVSFALSEDVLSSIELGDISAIVTADPTILGGFAVQSVAAGMMEDMQMAEDAVLEAFVLTSDEFTAVRCPDGCE